MIPPSGLTIRWPDGASLEETAPVSVFRLSPGVGTPTSFSIYVAGSPPPMLSASCLRVSDTSSPVIAVGTSTHKCNDQLPAANRLRVRVTSGRPIALVSVAGMYVSVKSDRLSLVGRSIPVQIGTGPTVYLGPDRNRLTARSRKALDIKSDASLSLDGESLTFRSRSRTVRSAKLDAVEQVPSNFKTHAELLYALASIIIPVCLYTLARESFLLFERMRARFSWCTWWQRNVEKTPSP